MNNNKITLAAISFLVHLLVLTPVFSTENVELKTDESCTVGADMNKETQSGDPADENSSEDIIDEPVAVSSPSASIPVYSKHTQTVVKRSEAYFRKAVINFELGNKEKSRELFNQSVKALYSSELDEFAFYQARSNLDAMFDSFNKLFSISNSTTSSVEKYEIPMDKDNSQVKKYIELYSKGGCRERIKLALERSGRYRQMIEKTLREYGLPRELVYLPVVESLYNVNDRSRAGAVGLWQFMPSRTRDFDMRLNYWIDERKDPEKSTRAAARYLRDLYYMFDSWHLALAAYNRGEFGLARDLKFSKATNIEQISERRAVPKETELYVPQFIACTIIGDDPKTYGFDLHYDKPLKYDEIALDKIVDLEVAAKCAGISTSEIKELNPALKAWCTPHGYPGYVLKIPPGTKDSFIVNLAQTKELNPSNGFIKYRVAKGDYIGKIAKKFSTSVTAVKEDNHIKNVKALRIGQVLVIRPGRKYSPK